MAKITAVSNYKDAATALQDGDIVFVATKTVETNILYPDQQSYWSMPVGFPGSIRWDYEHFPGNLVPNSVERCLERCKAKMTVEFNDQR